MRRSLLLALGALLPGFVAALGEDSARQHDILANVLAFDPQAPSITYRDEHGATASSPLLTEAASQALARLETGDLVELTVRDKPNGEREGVLAIKLLATVR